MVNANMSVSPLGILIQRGREPLDRASEWAVVMTHISILMRPQQSLPRERRNLAARRALTRRIVSEYSEMPGLRLTAAQASRLFSLRDDVCMRLLGELVHAGYLRRDAAGTYARHSTAA